MADDISLVDAVDTPNNRSSDFDVTTGEIVAVAVVNPLREMTPRWIDLMAPPDDCPTYPNIPGFIRSPLRVSRRY